MTFTCAICENKMFDIDKDLKCYYKCGNCDKVICDKCYPFQQAKYHNIKDIMNFKNGRLKCCDKCSQKKGRNVMVATPVIAEFYNK